MIWPTPSPRRTSTQRDGHRDRLANYRLHPGEDAEHFERLKPYDKNGDGALTWPEVCPEATDVPVRGCDDRDWACAQRSPDDDVAGLLPPRLAAVGSAKCCVVPNGALADAAESTGAESSPRLERRGAAGGLDAGDGG